MFSPSAAATGSSENAIVYVPVCPDSARSIDPAVAVLLTSNVIVNDPASCETFVGAVIVKSVSETALTADTKNKVASTNIRVDLAFML